jgi:hypothetical protein
MYGDQEIIVLTGIFRICGIVGLRTTFGNPVNPKNPKDRGQYWDF